MTRKVLWPARGAALLAGASAIALLAAGAAQAQEVVMIGETAEGALVETDGQLSSGEKVDVFLFRGEANQQVTIRHPGGAEMVVVNVHLRTAATDLRLWDKSAWVAHKNNRVLRQQELAVTLQILEDTVPFPNIPVIFGGDFNAPATDLVHRQLTPDFNDAFASAGTGWGNTYQRRFPILRIDPLYATRHFTPLRSRVVTTRNSDHRMVIADFLPGPSVAP